MAASSREPPVDNVRDGLFLKGLLRESGGLSHGVIREVLAGSISPGDTVG